jgi:hypothetical protein
MASLEVELNLDTWGEAVDIYTMGVEWLLHMDGTSYKTPWPPLVYSTLPNEKYCHG